MTVVHKKNGDVRITVDSRELNKHIIREYHPIPDVHYILHCIENAKVFSRLDAKSGFDQVELDEDSRLLTTFITPFGRYCSNRLPMGTSPSPEHYQKKMQQVLEGCEGIIILMDDILIFGKDVKEHNTRLLKVLQKLEAANVTLNEDKIAIGVESIEFVGHIISKDGISIHPDKVKAIVDMEPPANKKELQELLGLVNFVAKAVPDRSTVLEPLYSLLKKERAFVRDAPQVAAFDKLKTILTSAPVLMFFDPTKETIVTADASSYGIGGALFQRQDDGSLRPVAYVSKSLTETEKRYAQIEKEALAQAWTCEKLEDFILGIHVKLETDHKPLVPIFTSKPLDSLSPRLQRYCIRLMRFDYSISYVPGKDLVTADALSRRPLKWVDGKDDELEAQMCGLINSLPVSSQKLEQIIVQQQCDEELAAIKAYVTHGWPRKQDIAPNLHPYWEKRHEITLQNNLLMIGVRIIIPRDLRSEMMSRIHDGHLGITKCRARAKTVIWWPGMSTEIATLIQNCIVCAENRSNKHEPLMQYAKADKAWQKASMDLFKLDSNWYLIMIDRYSRYLEIEKLPNINMGTVINVMKSILARHGIPEEIVTDNGTQFKPYHGSKTFDDFEKDYGFKLITRSPSYPQSNGLAESGVKIAKAIIKKNKDWHKGLLIHRNSPLENGYSPAELCMNRKLRDTLPVVSSNLFPKIPDREEVERKESNRRNRIEENYNRSKGARLLPELTPGDKVFIKDTKSHGEVIQKAEEPRSYIVSSGGNQLRRNRHTLIKTQTKLEPVATTSQLEPQQHAELSRENLTSDSERTQAASTSPASIVVEPTKPLVRTSKFGRQIKPPVRYKP